MSITEQDRAFVVWRNNHDPRKYPAERDAFEAGWQAAIEADRKRRGEPVAVIRYERNTPGRENEMPRVISCNRLPDGDYPVFTAPQPAEPVKMPSDQQILQLMLGFGTHTLGDTTATFTGAGLLAGCRELLARYGNAAQPATSTEPTVDGNQVMP